MSQPGPTVQPETLDEAAQQQLIQDIGRVIVRALPPGWQEATVEYRAVGEHEETVAQLTAPNGSAIPLGVPAETGELFTKLRDGMYRPDRGTWVSALYRLQRPGSYTVDFNGDYRPNWRAEPPADAYAEELKRYPRPESAIPAWFQSTPGVTTNGDLRTAEVFDDNGRPITDRPDIPADERDRVADYLERAPIVLATRSYDTDRLDPKGPTSVPMTFHTDGSWVWPGAVGYYLRTHGVAPEPELLEHVRAQDFQLPEVSEPQRERAASLITGTQRN